MNGIARVAAVLACAALVGCPDKIPTPGPDGAPSSSTSSNKPAPDASTALAAKEAGQNDPPPEAKIEMHAIEGVGDVPVWTEEHGRGVHCVTSDAAKSRIEALSKGEDASISEGKADVRALQKEIAGDCVTTSRALAQALNDGGYQRYKKKAYAEANRWWRAALVVRPALAIARYDLACGLALDKKLEAAVWALSELARAAQTGDPTAANFIEKAKSDDDLKAIREDEGYKSAIASSHGGLVGPRKEPETAAIAIKMLPTDFLVGPKPEGGLRTYHPAFIDFWTWRPDAETELLVGTIVHDPASLGKPKGDLNSDYGGIAVLKREPGNKVTVLHVSKTGESPPAVAAGKNGTVVYGFSEPCGDLKGMLIWRDHRVIAKEMSCNDLGLQ
jgi:hypothetical protein